MVSIKIAGTVDDSIVDGEGYRFTIFTQGCPHNCPGCHNPQTHDSNKGKLVNADDLIQRIKQNPLLSGVTFSGGEPFLQPQPLNYIAEKIHRLSLDLTVYTGYTLEQLQDMHNAAIDKLLSLTDTLIDGRFLLEQRDLTLTFRGSRNQRIIDMNASRQQNKIVLKLLD